MENKVLYALIWRLAMRQHELLHEVLPVAQRMGRCLRADLKPDVEELQQWLTIEHKTHRVFGQLTEEIAGIERMVEKSPPPFDS